MSLDKKLALLEACLKRLGSVAVAFSGGVDSSFLLAFAHKVLGGKAIAITAVSPIFPEHEQQEAFDFCKGRSISQITFEADVLSDPDFYTNPPDRCYICKKQLFKKILDIAQNAGIKYVCEGSNLSDKGDYRPGMRAIAELRVLSPLLECGLGKDEIRSLSKDMGLSTWNKSSFACLASRFVYGEHIMPEKVAMVEKAEKLLHDIGFAQYRVRIHSGNLARIEVLPEDLPHLMECRTQIADDFKKLGFSYVSADMVGYRTGSMNEMLSEGEKHGICNT